MRDYYFHVYSRTDPCQFVTGNLLTGTDSSIILLLFYLHNPALNGLKNVPFMSSFHPQIQHQSSILQPADALTSPHARSNFIMDAHQHASTARSKQPLPCLRHEFGFVFHAVWIHMLPEHYKEPCVTYSKSDMKLLLQPTCVHKRLLHLQKCCWATKLESSCVCALKQHADRRVRAVLCSLTFAGMFLKSRDVLIWHAEASMSH